MEFKRASLRTCAEATGTVVVIDVLRAFTTAAYAFAAGATDILLAGSVEEAFKLRDQFPERLIFGEKAGLPVEGFNFSNSPADLAGQDFTGRGLIQRTSNGTKGIVLSARADRLLAASLVCATATAAAIAAEVATSPAAAIRKLAPDSLTFVITGHGPDHYGDEDAACADWIEAVLTGKRPDVHPFIRRVYDSPSGKVFADPSRPEYPAADLDFCAQVDRFDFAMQVRRQDGLLVMEPFYPETL
jgi:2-phosphosulfolactate phosphatase